MKGSTLSRFEAKEVLESIWMALGVQQVPMEPGLAAEVRWRKGLTSQAAVAEIEHRDLAVDEVAVEFVEDSVLAQHSSQTPVWVDLQGFEQQEHAEVPVSASNERL